MGHDMGHDWRSLLVLLLLVDRVDLSCRVVHLLWWMRWQQGHPQPLPVYSWGTSGSALAFLMAAKDRRWLPWQPRFRYCLPCTVSSPEASPQVTLEHYQIWKYLASIGKYWCLLKDNRLSGCRSGLIFQHGSQGSKCGHLSICSTSSQEVTSKCAAKGVVAMLCCIHWYCRRMSSYMVLLSMIVNMLGSPDAHLHDIKPCQAQRAGAALQAGRLVP